MNAILVLCALVGFASASPFRDCGSQKGTITKFTVEGCPDGKGIFGSKCFIKKGSTVSAEVEFTPSEDVADPTIEGFANGLGFRQAIPPMKGYNKHICRPGEPDASHMQCPLKANEPATYSINLPLTDDHVKCIEVSVDWVLKDEAGNKIICLETDIKIYP